MLGQVEALSESAADAKDSKSDFHTIAKQCLDQQRAKDRQLRRPATRAGIAPNQAL